MLAACCTWLSPVGLDVLRSAVWGSGRDVGCRTCRFAFRSWKPSACWVFVLGVAGAGWRGGTQLVAAAA